MSDTRLIELTLSTGETVIGEVVLGWRTMHLTDESEIIAGLSKDLSDKYLEGARCGDYFEKVNLPPNLAINRSHIVKIKLEPEISKLKAILNGVQTNEDWTNQKIEHYSQIKVDEK